MTTNRNPTTGIPYGVISAASLHEDTVADLMYGPDAKHHGYPDDFSEDYSEPYQDPEPSISGTLDGVTYATLWLGGALNFFIFDSPVLHKGQQCSPCVPFACNLDSSGEYLGYGVPDEWRLTCTITN